MANDPLRDLEIRLLQDLNFINFPADSWTATNEKHLWDVVIIGAGMAGLAVAFALMRLGITHIKIYDAAPNGTEGPWATYARMKILRSTKELTGPAFDFPSLTFRAWYEALYGENGWRDLGKIPTLQWMDYLNWFRTVLKLPVENNSKLLSIDPKESCLEIQIQKPDQIAVEHTRKIVLATGRAGFGGVIIPKFMDSIPKKYYAHTNDWIDFQALKGKRLGIIGAGAAGFDAAATALEEGVGHVDLLIRRSHLPNVNKFASITYAGFTEGYYYLSDTQRVQMLSIGFDTGATPPMESLMRIHHYKNVKMKRGIAIKTVSCSQNALQVDTNNGLFEYDYIILATGYAIDGSKQPELDPFMQKIQLWDNRNLGLNAPLKNYPYLGPSFEFLEKTPGKAPFLQDIYCFNYAATLSHGLLSSDIPGIGAGANRLARGMASHFFTQDDEKYIDRLKNYQRYEFFEEDFDFITQKSSQ